MKFQISKQALIIAAFDIAFTFPNFAHADALSELRALKAQMAEQQRQMAAQHKRLKELERVVEKQSQQTREAKAEAKHATNVVQAAAVKGAPNAPPPVFVSLKNGLLIGTVDGDYIFRVGGRVHVAGSAVTDPLNGYSGHGGIRRGRLQVEGKAKDWFYKAQYDFAGTTTTIYNGLRIDSPTTSGVNGLYGQSYISQGNYVLQGIRDMYFGYQGPATRLPFTKEPAFVMIGSQFEPFSLEAVTSSNYIDLAERALPTDVFSPARHVGAAVGAYGDLWSFKGGVFTTSMEDANLNPGKAVPGVYGVPKYLGNNWWAQSAGGNYFDITGRATYALYRTEHDLLHVGVSGRYHQVNTATAYNDDRVLALGNRGRSEDFFSGQQLLGTPDMSCGVVAEPVPFVVRGVTLSTSSTAGKCTKDVETINFELAASHGPFSLQAEYYGSWYNRDRSKLLQNTFRQVVDPRTGGVPASATFFNPGGASNFFSGYYIQGQYWLTGEEKVSAYKTDDKAGASFRQINIKQPLSAGGWGALGLIARLSSVDLNNGPYQGSNLYNMLYWAQTSPMLAGPNAAATAANRARAQNYIANAGVNGGFQQNVTLGVNWLPEEGIWIQANWTRVMDLKAPLNLITTSSYYSGAHPSLFQLMAKVYW